MVVDLFKYRQLERALLRTYEPADQIPQQQPPQLMTAEPKNDNIVYVPVERRENWANILGDIRNHQMRPSQSSTTTHDINIQNIEGVPVINLQRRHNTSTKLISKSSIIELKDQGDHNKISIPKFQSASVLITPQRRASLGDSGKVVRVMRSRPNSGDKRRQSYHENKTSIQLDQTPNDQIIDVHRNLSAVQLGRMLADSPGRSSIGNLTQDENGLVRERIIIRRKKTDQTHSIRRESENPQNEQKEPSVQPQPQPPTSVISEMPRICERGESVDSIAIVNQAEKIVSGSLDFVPENQSPEDADLIVLPPRSKYVEISSSQKPFET